MVLHWSFEWIIFAAILASCVMLALDTPNDSARFEGVRLAVEIADYAFMVSLGFIQHVIQMYA